MPDLIRHPETLKRLDSGFRRNDTFYENFIYGQTLLNKDEIRSNEFSTLWEAL